MPGVSNFLYSLIVKNVNRMFMFFSVIKYVEFLIWVEISRYPNKLSEVYQFPILLPNAI
jgi:hypothetical protein